MDTNHLPVSGRGVFARRRQGATAESRFGSLNRTDVGKRFDIAQAELRQVGQVQPPLSRNIAERVAANVSVCSRVRHFADSNAIQHDPDDAMKGFGCH